MSNPVDIKQFMGMRSERSVPERCRFFVLPVPYEKTTSYRRGTARGPMALPELTSYKYIEQGDGQVRE